MTIILTSLKTGGATWSRTKNVYPVGTDLQSADAHAIASIAPYDISLDDALFATLNGIGGHTTVYVRSYSGLTFPPWLTSSKLIPHLITLGV